MKARVSRTDLQVGLFILGAVAVVLVALVATSGWGVDRYDLFIRTDDASDVAIDTRIYLAGFEVGRVARVEPRPAPGGRGIEFIIRASVLAKYPDNSELRLPRGMHAEIVEELLGGAKLELFRRDTIPGWIEAGDTLDMRRRTPAMEAFGALATDLRGTVQGVLETTTRTLNAVRILADSLTLATGTARRFVSGIQPETEKTLAEASASLIALQHLLDSTTVRTGTTVQQVNAAIRQGQTLLASADSLTRLMVALGAENRPEVRQILINTRQLSEQLQFVMEQLGRRPMRFVTGVTIPDSLTVEGRARRDSLARAIRDSLARDSLARRPITRDTTRPDRQP